jgi:hypothetical protein
LAFCGFLGLPGKSQTPSDRRTENHGSKGKEPLGFLIIIPLIPIDSRVALVKAIRLFAFYGLEFAKQPSSWALLATLRDNHKAY